MSQNWDVYLSGEIHTDWRDRIAAGIEAAGLPVSLSAPVTDHSASDDCGVEILGQESSDFWKDHKGARINAIRTRTLIERADVVVVSCHWGVEYSAYPNSFQQQMAGVLADASTRLLQDFFRARR